MRAGTAFAFLKAFESLRTKLHQVTDPFILIHGTADDVTSIEGSRKLAQQAKSEKKTYIEIENANHVLHEEPPQVLQGIMFNTIRWLDNVIKH